jgi:hypothetical protein
MTSPASGSGGWYVITYRKTPQDPFTVQVSQKPFPPGQALVDSGPYATQAAAEAAAQKLRTAPVPGTSIPNPFSWVGAVAHWIGDFALHITDAPMWISIGWITLGAILIFSGIMLWLKIPQQAGKLGLAAAAA